MDRIKISEGKYNMLKIEKEYFEKYGDIPYDNLDRIDYLLDNSNLSKYKVGVIQSIKNILKIKWNTLNFTIYLLPSATPRPRSGNGSFYVKGASDNKKFFKKYMDNNVNMITTPCKVHCITYAPIPKTMHPIEKVLAELGFIQPISKPDWDNLAKTYCDMIQGLVLYDDSLIVEGTLIKKYSLKPRIEMSISYMEDYASQFNKNKMKGKI